jgi:hypothetical protein
VGNTHASTNGDVETDELLGFLVNDGDEADVVREDIDVVLRGDGDGDLELQRGKGKMVSAIDCRRKEERN